MYTQEVGTLGRAVLFAVLLLFVWVRWKTTSVFQTELTLFEWAWGCYLAGSWLLSVFLIMGQQC